MEETSFVMYMYSKLRQSQGLVLPLHIADSENIGKS